MGEAQGADLALTSRVLVPLTYWSVGKCLIGGITHTLAPLTAYGRDRVPHHGGAVLAMNHFHAIDPAVFGTASPRRIVFAAKVEAHRTAGLGALIRAHGSLSVRRGASDRDAIQAMRRTVRANHLLGMFVEGTRQRSGRPGEAKPGAVMVAISEGVPIIPAAVHGSQHWRFGHLDRVAVAFGEPMRFDEHPRGSRGYRLASAEVMSEIVRLWDFLCDMRDAGHPQGAPPRRAQVPSRLG
ncbi:MAG: lysophospholipid acyltransferase family protein [Gaiellales bacterium]